MRRSGETVNATLALEEDPRFEIVPVEQAGGTLTAAQKQFRDAVAWISPVIGGQWSVVSDGGQVGRNSDITGSRQ